MMSKIPVDLDKVSPEDLNKEILRAAIVAELDAINLYEQMADLAENEEVRRVLLDVALEEKTHVGEFQVMLLRQDGQQKEELKAGEEKVNEKLSK
ncbi:ferritin family protein [Methanolobus sp. ZRKC2]|uniref:ferritin-like domain-containing protein n=1 Tax=Methanolobus sp. ZRKC2 TaxID=3125783 RepID=UPI00324A7E38